MKNIGAYYKILGLTENANLEELKRAYRKKALLLHPDHNNSPNAHEEFIFLTEAYEYLSKLKSGVFQPPQQGQENSKTTTVSTANRKSEWQYWQQEEIKRKAVEYANMQYKEFVKSDYYKALDSLNYVFSCIYLFFGILMIAGVPVIFAIAGGPVGLLLGIVFVVIVLLTGFRIIRNTISQINFKTFAKAAGYLVHTYPFWFIIISLLNIFLFLKIGLQTLIYPWLLFLIYIFFVAVTWLIVKCGYKISAVLKRNFYSFCIAPLFVNMLLILNFAFSNQPATETYSFRNKLQKTYNGYQESNLIILEDNKYGRYPGIRIFANYEQTSGKKYIVYTFKTGLLGIRVMTHYKFY